MKAPIAREFSRRRFIASTGALVVSFRTVFPRLACAQQPPAAAGGAVLPGSLKGRAHGSIRGYAWVPTAASRCSPAKAELGQGIKTALIQNRGGGAGRRARTHRAGHG